MRAKEYFEGIRAEVVKTDKAREMLERMKAREGAKVQSYPTGGSGGDVSDPMESVSQRIDFEGKLRQRIADAEGTLDEACEVLYGSDGRGGLARMKGALRRRNLHVLNTRSSRDMGRDCGNHAVFAEVVPQALRSWV